MPWIKILSLFFQAQMIPLFLGADVLSSTDVRTENHPRYHAKFAKKGLATKIQFSSGTMFAQNDKMHTWHGSLFVLLFFLTSIVP